MSGTATSPRPGAKQGWRKQVQVHPAAEVFPMMGTADLHALADDIKTNGLRQPIVYLLTGRGERLLLDGRNQLAALELAGKSSDTEGKIVNEGEVDPCTYVVSANLRRLWPDAEIQVVDFYDADTMTEPAIARARAGRRHGDPLAEIQSGLDAAFVVLAAHELRTREGRAAFFRRVGGALAPGGRLVLLEHLRDPQNALVYGPGALHFLPRTAYLAAFEDSGLELLEERAMTPFLRLFVLGR